MIKAKGRDEDFSRYLTFLIWTGARRVEALMSEWQDINWERQTCLLRHTKGKRDRIVPLMPDVIGALQAVRKDIGRIFPACHPDTMTKKFHDLARECGIRVRLHDLRHSAAVYMLKSGIPIQVVSKILGHAELSTTMVYAHVLDEIKREEMKKMRIE